MTVETSQGKRRPRVPRPGEHADATGAAMAAPLKDATTGRFLPGNQAGRLRAVKALGSLGTLNPKKCAPWVRPYVELVPREASALVSEAGAEASESLKGFATAAAEAHAMYRALMAIALAEDTDPTTATSARSEARAWLKEHRQSLLSLRAEARAGVPERADAPFDIDREIARLSPPPAKVRDEGGLTAAAYDIANTALPHPSDAPSSPAAEDLNE